MSTDERREPGPDPEEPSTEGSSTEPLTLKNPFGTALGSAMLGFEQALRNEPPAEILAAEHMPERGGSGQGSDLLIEFPIDRADDDGDD